MTNLIEKVLSTGGGALAMTRDKATEIVNDLVEKGEVKREDAQALIDELVAWGREARTNLRETLAEQVAAFNARIDAIQADLYTGTEETLEKARQELSRLGEQIADVQGRLSETGAQVEESTQRTLERAREQLAVAQTDLAQAAEKIRAGAVREAQHGIEALRTAVDKAYHILRRT